MKTTNILIKSLLLFILTQTFLFAGYSIDKSYTTSGASISQWGGSSILKLQASLSGTNLTLTASKQSGSFSSIGTMYFKVGSYESYGANRDTKTVYAGNSSVSSTHNLASYSDYPKYFYARYQSPDGGWTWVGPIKVSYTEPVPLTPSPPSATAQGTNKIYISWSSVSGATNYKLYRATSYNGSYQQIYYSNGTAYTDSGTHLSPNTTYYYKVQAGNDTGWSGYSSYRSVKTDSIPVPTITSVSPSSLNEGDVNQYIYINGTNLDSVTKVFIAGVVETTTFISKTTTQIKVQSSYVNGSGNANVPKGDRPIEVLYDGGKKITKSGLLFVNDKVLAPTITSVSPSSLNEGDVNQYIYINGTNLDSVTKVFIAGVVETTTFISKTTTQIKVQSSYVNGSGNANVPKGDRPIEVLYDGGKKITKSGLLFVNK